MPTWSSALAMGAVLGGCQPDHPAREISLYDVPPRAWETPSRVETADASPDGPRVVRNVTQPTLTVVLPLAGTASGVGVLVIPGGGFFALAIDDQGLDVAHWLASWGITAFVLKYRLEAATDRKSMQTHMQQLMGALAADPNGLLPGEATADLDAHAAFALLRKRAAEFGVDPSRLGVIGFSAGAFMAIDLAAAPGVRPAFIGDLYAPVRSGVRVPEGAPPMFTAFAADDPLFAKVVTASFDRWRQAGAPAELHVYEAGGHGFGMRPQGKPSDGWTGDLYRWLVFHGWVKSGGPNGG